MSVPAMPDSLVSHGRADRGLRGDLLVLVAVVVIVAAAVAINAGSLLKRCDGELIYALDDAYIHAGIARNMAQSGTWGLTPGLFASASSAPLWTGLLAAVFWAIGPQTLAIGILESLAAVGLIVMLWALLRHRVRSRVTLAIALLAVALGMPLLWQMATGMEHVLQSVLTLGLLSACVACVAAKPGRRAFWGSPETRWPAYATLCSLSAMCATIRYEGLFAVLAVSTVLWLDRKRRLSAATAIAGLLPLVALGCVSAAKGWFFLPNSVMLKGNIPTGQGIAYALARLLLFGAYKLVQNPFLALMVVLAVWTIFEATRRGVHWRDPETLPAVLFLAVGFSQLHFAGTGMFLTRYVAYLVPIGVWATAPWVEQSLLNTHAVSRVSRGAVAVGVVLLLGLLGQRGVQGWRLAQDAAADIYRQQWQMGRFLSGYAEGRTVAVNDIGAVAFWGGPELLDLWGLASTDVARAMKRGTYGPDFIAALAEKNDAQLAVVSPRGFDEWGGLPTDWKLLAIWKLTDPSILNQTVGFYAIRPEVTRGLEAALRDFEPELPNGIEVSYGAQAVNAQ